MRVYLDTNVLYFLLVDNRKDLSGDVKALFEDYNNVNYTSILCVQELIHLYQIGKLPNTKKRSELNDATDILGRLRELDISIVPVNEHHLAKYSELPMLADHRDPNDRLIIAQAISDQITLVSSDRKFSQYAKNGLNFIINKR